MANINKDITDKINLTVVLGQDYNERRMIWNSVILGSALSTRIAKY